MESPEISIEVYDKRTEVSSRLRVIELSKNTYRMVENDIINCTLTFGTEFETRINKQGKKEVVRIIKESPFETRQFFLDSQFSVEEFRLLGDEIIKNGGFWQVDFGSMATINLPMTTEMDLDKIFEIFNFNPVRITEDPAVMKCKGVVFDEFALPLFELRSGELGKPIRRALTPVKYMSASILGAKPGLIGCPLKTGGCLIYMLHYHIRQTLF